MGASTHESSGGIHAHGQLKLKKALPAQNVQQLNNKGRTMVPSTVLSPVVVPASVPNNKTQNDGLLRVSTFWETLHLEEKRLLLRIHGCSKLHVAIHGCSKLHVVWQDAERGEVRRDAFAFLQV